MNKTICKLFSSAMLVCSIVLLAACGGNNGRYRYQTVPGDPMNVQTYQLKNGLTVAMTVNKEQREQAHQKPSAALVCCLRISCSSVQAISPVRKSFMFSVNLK